MDLAQQLVRSCVRSFYDTKHILVVDALVIHSAYVLSTEKLWNEMLTESTVCAMTIWHI
jgi:hypothetical protein